MGQRPGLTEGQKSKINKEVCPKKDIISVAEREQEVLNNVPESHWKKIGNYHPSLP